VKARRAIELFLAIALVASAIRLALIYYERHSPAPARQPSSTTIDPDYYVVPKKQHAYDLKSARAGMAGHPAWIREGYKFTYYPYDLTHRRADFAHSAGLLLPLEEVDVRDVVQVQPPSASELPQIVAVFGKNGEDFAVPIGARRGEDYTIYADDMFFFENPHQLYRHWAPQVWQAVDRHQVLPGMNEIQASFALGMGIPQRGDDQESKTVVYPNGGNQVIVVFRGGKATEIKSGS